MIMIKRWKTIGYCLLGLLVAGCGQNDTGTTQSILSKPPYAGITDSIKAAPQNAELYLTRGIRLSQNNQHELATGDYKKAWELAPDEGTALQYISNLMLVDEPATAVELLKSCIEKYPANPSFRRRLSEVYAQVGESEQALEQYNQLLAKDSLDFETWYEKGSLLVQLKDTAAAIAAMERSYSLQPANYTGLPLANLYANTKNPKALELCDALIIRDTSYFNDATFLKGVYYSDTKQYAAALEQFEECIKRNWKFTDAYIEKGIVLYDQKQYDSALEVFSMAATVSNTSPDAYYWMARCYEATKRNDQALQNYQRALSLDKQFTEAKEAIKRLKG
jgi:tetratricopeptide (TPR) repeat protein